jgi:citrate lyase subunit beta/citryl-CoA lyase
VPSRRLGYRCKSLVLPEHAEALNATLTPNADEIRFARKVIESFDMARARGEHRAFVEGLWVEVPTYRNARKLIERAERLGET